MEKNINKQKKLNTGLDTRDKPTPKFRYRLDIAIGMRGFKDYNAFAKKTYYTRSFISKVLHGHIDPTLAQAENLAKALDVPLQKIFDITEIRDLNLGFVEANKLEDADE